MGRRGEALLPAIPTFGKYGILVGLEALHFSSNPLASNTNEANGNQGIMFEQLWGRGQGLTQFCSKVVFLKPGQGFTGHPEKNLEMHRVS